MLRAPYIGMMAVGSRTPAWMHMNATAAAGASPAFISVSFLHAAKQPRRKGQRTGSMSSGHTCAEVTPGRVAADNDALRSGPQHARVGEGPAVRVETPVRGWREGGVWVGA